MKNFKIYFYWFLDFAFFADNFIKEDEAEQIIGKIKKAKLKNNNRLEISKKIVFPKNYNKKTAEQINVLLTKEGVLYLTFFKQGLNKKNRVFKLKQRLKLHEIIKEKKAVLKHCKRRF